MAIDGEIVQVSKLALQPKNLWEIVFTDAPDIKYRVQNINLPFIGLETQTRKTGSKHYIEYKPEEDFNMTILETVDFAAYDYIIDWRNSIYDYQNRVWKTGPAAFKTFTLAFQVNADYPVVTIVQRGRKERFPFPEWKYNKAFRFERVLLKNINQLDLDYQNGDPLMWELTLTADRIVEVPVSDLTTRL